MQLIVVRDGDLYRLSVLDRGVRRPLLLPGETPSWAGGWAGRDGAGGYDREAALEVLRSFGLSEADAERALLVAQLKDPSPRSPGLHPQARRPPIKRA